MTRPLDEAGVRALVRDEVRSVLRELLGRLDASAEGFSSRKGCGPVGYSDERWKTIARQIGVRRGRWFFVSKEALAAYEARGGAKASADAPANDAPVSTWHPSEIAKSLALRPVGRGGSR